MYPRTRRPRARAAAAVLSHVRPCSARSATTAEERDFPERHRDPVEAEDVGAYSGTGNRISSSGDAGRLVAGRLAHSVLFLILGSFRSSPKPAPGGLRGTGVPETLMLSPIFPSPLPPSPCPLSKGMRGEAMEAEWRTIWSRIEDDRG